MFVLFVIVKIFFERELFKIFLIKKLIKEGRVKSMKEYWTPTKSHLVEIITYELNMDNFIEIFVTIHFRWIIVIQWLKIWKCLINVERLFISIIYIIPLVIEWIVLILLVTVLIFFCRAHFSFFISRSSFFHCLFFFFSANNNLALVLAFESPAPKKWSCRSQFNINRLFW